MTSLYSNFILISCVLIYLGQVCVLDAATLSSEINHLIEVDNRIKEQKSNTLASSLATKATIRTKFPTLSITTGLAREALRNTGSASTLLNPRDIDASVAIPIFNVALDGTLKQTRLSEEQAQLLQQSISNSVVLEGVSTYLNLLSAKQFLDYANTSVRNIQAQTKLQDAKISIGTGLTSDLLQAKSQLAGAEARRAQAELSSYQAEVLYITLFGRMPNSPMEPVTFSPSWLPDNVDECIKLALENNIDYSTQRKTYQILKLQKNLQQDTLIYPSLNLVLNGKWKRDVAGVAGFERDLSAKLQLTHQFNLGGSGIYLYRSSVKNLESGLFRDLQARTVLERSVRSAWGEYRYLKENSEFLKIQLDLSREFLDLARQEQALGNRSLLDVLTGETAEINAASDYYVAESLQKTSGFRILSLIDSLKNYIE